MTNVKFSNNTTYPIVAYVVTQNDSVYAFDGTNCNLIQKTGLLVNAAQGETAVNCNDIFGNCQISPTVGILGTPVIEIDQTSPTTTGTLYAVAESECAATTQCAGGVNTFFHRTHALPITSLSDSTYTQICASGCGGESATLFSHDHIQRPGLLWLPAAQSGLGHNEVYMAFSMMDGTTLTNPNGWIWAYNAQNLSQTPLSYETTHEPSAQLEGYGKAQQVWRRAWTRRPEAPTSTSAPVTEISTSTTLVVRMHRTASLR